MKTILFDLDATLLPMNQDEFIISYFNLLENTFSDYGYDTDKFKSTVKESIYAMLCNDGVASNENVFWSNFIPVLGDIRKDFEKFYETAFDKMKEKCSPDPFVRQIIQKLRSDGHRLVIASNPVFPLIAQKKRIMWSGLDPNDFCYITSYENSCSCKPNTKYYSEIVNNIKVSPKDCIMIGNDVDDDMAAKDIGMDVFLLTNCLINRNNKDISAYLNGNFEQLLNFINKLNK